MSTSHSASKENETVEQMTGPDMMNEIIREPTLDRFLDRSPLADPLSDMELMDLISLMRMARANFEMKEAKKQAKKEGIEDDDE